MPDDMLAVPKCKAILLCERPIIDAITGDVTLIGVFESIHLMQVPGVTRPFTWETADLFKGGSGMVDYSTHCYGRGTEPFQSMSALSDVDAMQSSPLHRSSSMEP